jgi:hypothetical protein
VQFNRTAADIQLDDLLAGPAFSVCGTPSTYRGKDGRGVKTIAFLHLVRVEAILPVPNTNSWFKMVKFLESNGYYIYHKVRV